MRRLEIHRLTALVAVTATVLCGCDNTTVGQSPKQPERWPAILADSTFVWSAEPGIDLLTQPIVAVRAYSESLVLAEITGSNDYLYPGFDHAVKSEKPADYSHYSLHLWPELSYPKKDPEVGSSRQHVLRVAQDGQDVSVVMCTWDWGLAVEKPSGLYATLGSWRPPSADIGVQLLRLEAPAGSPVPDTPPQKGPSRYALTDVFGQWRIVGRLSPELGHLA
ncbi:hypothetical protein MSAR_20800 [Mycolicibacterium sarraceniae]|uniref:Lipoprotein n=1 Tax=Mycolicibacterium sarraceniae TaxID=1534348 RepID=A0A7I7SPL0_9MYCO|nr:hypothetical protein MSAR_20800 [Mycolicibacterium sarraceniae]